MRPRRTPLAFVAILSVLIPVSGLAQPAGKPWRIGYLTSGFKDVSGSNPAVAPFIGRLRELGLVEGRNITLEQRYAEGRPSNFAALAAELVELKVDVLVASSTPAALAAKHATSSIPIVMLNVGEPLQVKLVQSLSHPGGNITGLSLVAPELAAKRLDLLKQAVPTLSRVTVLWNASNEGMAPRFRETQLAAQSLGLTLRSATVKDVDDFEPVFATLAKERAEPLIVLADTVTVANRQRTVDFAARNRVPAIYESRAFVDAGGLMSYGVDTLAHARRAADYVDKVLKGARPGDMPIEEPTKFELVINLKTARTLGLTLPHALLLRADQVIE